MQPPILQLFSPFFMMAVLQILQSLMVKESPVHLYEQSLSCLASWVQFGVPLPQLESLTVETLQALHNPQLFDTAIETVVHIILQHENYRFIFQRIIHHFTSSHIDDVIVAMTYTICYCLDTRQAWRVCYLTFWIWSRYGTKRSRMNKR